jgi:putative phosphoserine phosphatase / 1-acylglycerol-3-phosphate O-acyltransferase
MNANGTNRAAAIFDLDRTLLAGASGPVLSRALRAVGVLGSKPMPGEALVTSLFNTIGETLPMMALTRQAASLAKGRSRSAFQTAAESAADALVDLLQPLAPALFAEHRENGRMLVLATTTPYDLVKPFADRLGFDHVIATRYGSDDDVYNGRIDGPFVWSVGKLNAVKAWAEEAAVDLQESFFYSDSVYDSPLMGYIGNPVVVNPDPRMMLMAAARRWPTVNLGAPGHGLQIAGLDLEPQKLVLAMCRQELMPFVRFDIAGTSAIPKTGPAILVGNHRSYFDVAAMAMAIARTGRTVRFLGKKEVFDAPLVGQMATAMGGIRVNRGTGSDEPLRAAAAALEAGDLVAIMPQGTIPRGAAFFDPELKGKWGAARLAAMTKAPVIPVGLWGTEKVWPRNSRVPLVWNVAKPPKVRIRVGKPVDLKYRSNDADTKKIMKALVKLLPAEAAKAYTPTAEELARTYPSGKKPA